MKTKIMILACACAALATTALIAATKQWQIFGDTAIAQIVADGAGGCAFVRLDTGDTGTVVWVDKKGVIKYQRTIGDTLPGGILSCTPKRLRFMLVKPPMVILDVDAHGVETEIKAPNGDMTTSELQAAQSTTADARGFFGILYMGPARQDLVRFNNK